MADTDPQLTRDDLAAMTPEQINTARAEGRLHDLLTGSPPATAPDPGHAPAVRFLTRDDLRTMTPEQINEARAKGNLAHLGVRPARITY